jgi:hypothetical protein
LLRSAAAAGPLIATLPSGAALAQTSAVQCVISEQEAPSDEQPQGVTQVADHYVRVAGFIEKWKVLATNQDVDVYHIPDVSSGLGYEVYVYAAPPNTGEWFDTDPSVATFLKSEPAAFLYLYSADYPALSKSAVATTPGSVVPADCEVTDPLSWPNEPSVPEGPKPPDHCFAPLAVQVGPPAQDGNVPLTHSCLCSINPTACVIPP